MEVYRTEFSVEEKADKTPLTLADRNAHEIIKDHLSKLGIPILSEEGNHIDYEERSKWESFWLVDPLDGTKEFIKRNGEFTVNIALIQDQVPVMGVVFAPDLCELYLAAPGWGSRKVELNCESDKSFQLPNLLEMIKLPIKENNRPFTVVGSRSHASEETTAFVEELKKNHPDLSFASKGSSLKLCLIAEGKADIYPRLAPTMEWDTAAGHALVLHSGGDVTEHESGQPLKYNKKNLLNPWFVAKI
jgi:3'(2'), 5'-bisphosphate nucleotidase